VGMLFPSPWMGSGFTYDPMGKKIIPATITQDILLTTASAPGLLVKLPAGLKITRPDGTPVTQMTISTVTPDRSPMPFPTGVAPIQLLSIQPADAILSEPVQITYPNLFKESKPGDKITLYRADHDTESGQFIPYGTGTVTADGRQIKPDVDPATGKPYGLPAFSWHYPAANKPAESQAPAGGCPTCQGAVDTASGTEKYQSTDFGVIGGRMPFAISRTYRSGDDRQGPFGIGSAHNFELILQETTPQLVELVQPNNYRTRFPMMTGSTTQYANEDDPNYRGAVLTKTSGTTYVLRMKNGAEMTFDATIASLNLVPIYNLSKITDRNRNAITVNRTGRANAITSISSASGQLTVEADPNTGRISKITDQGGRSVSYQYDAAGRLVTMTDPLGQTTSYTYDAANRLLTNTNPRGIVEASRTYDANGRITQEQYADGSVMQVIYNLINPTAPQGGIASTKVVMPNGSSQTFRVDSGLYASISTDGLGNGSLTNRTLGTNRVNSVTDRLGRVTVPTFDAKENLTQIKAPDGSITKFTYEPNFNLPISVTDALGKTSTITYDAKGNSTAMKDPLGKVTRLVYDSFGQVTSITNARNETSTLTYNDRGNVIKTTDALGHSTNMTYDILNGMIKTTNALNHVVQVQYDILDRTTQVTSAEGRVVKYAYDANSNLLSVADPKGNVTRYDYDSRDRLIKRTDALGKVETYAYDANSNLIKSTDRKGQVTTYQYDANDRLVSTTYADGKVVTSAFDDENRLISLNDTAPEAGQHNFTYDLLGRLTKESTPRGTVIYAYDVLGRRTSLKVNNQRAVTYSYDDSDRLTTITEGNETFGFSYDQLDRRAGITLPNGISTAYSYDAAGRLTGMKYSKGGTVLRDLTYGYDEINRRTAYSGNTAPAPRDTATDTATVNALNQYTSRNGKPVSHDDNANQTINNAVWDARDRLVSLSGPNFTASFTYDAMGKRTSKTINGQTKTYLYDGSDLISETGADYTFGPGIDQPLERKSGQNEYYLSDALGSVIGLTDGNGAIKTSYNYSPFGKKQTTGINSGNPFAFTGREDDGTGYYYYRARYYNPDQKRFIAADSLGFGGGDTNLQAYVGNSPTNFTDPSGNIPLDEIADVAFIAYDLYQLALNPNCSDNQAALGLDLLGLSIPYATGLGAANRVRRAEEAASIGTGFAKGLPDSALVCRGGACKAENFLKGSGVKQAADGTLSGVSTQSRAGASVNELAKPFKNNQVGVTTAGDIRAAGGRVTADGHPGNPNHATVDGLTPQQLERLFSPTIPNPVPPAQRGF
jgi:RHS repeat-associated protein